MITPPNKQPSTFRSQAQIRLTKGEHYQFYQWKFVCSFTETTSGSHRVLK